MLTQRQAAHLLQVSVSWLRESDAPRVERPGNGPKGRPIVRYPRAALLAWFAKGAHVAPLAEVG